jgi:hypothetical protein
MTKVHRVLNGPIEDEEGMILCVCLVECDGDLFDEEIYFEDMKTAMAFKAHFGKSIEPLTIEEGKVSYDLGH